MSAHMVIETEYTWNEYDYLPFRALITDWGYVSREGRWNNDTNEWVWLNHNWYIISMMMLPGMYVSLCNDDYNEDAEF